MFGSRRRRRQLAKEADRGSVEDSGHAVPRVEVEDRPRPRARLAWQVGPESEIARLQASLDRCQATTAAEDANIAGIFRQLVQARVLLNDLGERNWLVRHADAGAVYEQVLGLVQGASETLLLVEDEASVLARLPAMRAATKIYLGADDPRFDSYTQFIDRLASEAEWASATTAEANPSDAALEPLPSQSPRPRRSAPEGDDGF
jgi:hypothetical protein